MVICSRDYISPPVFMSQEEIPPLLQGCIPYAAICSRANISTVVGMHLLHGCIPPAVRCSRDYISPLVFIHLLQGCIPPAVICSRDYMSPLVSM